LCPLKKSPWWQKFCWWWTGWSGGREVGETNVLILVEDMLRNKCFFKVRISHVLRFIPICDLLTDSPSCLYSTPLETTMDPGKLTTNEIFHLVVQLQLSCIWITTSHHFILHLL
jgi:hypothetical protein